MSISTERAAAGVAVDGHRPDFFIVGNPKSGTTALYEMLRRHPQIYMPDLKETRYFSREHPRTPPSTTHPETLAQYLSLFGAAKPEQRAGEASSGYLRSPAAAGRIAELVPHARIIAVLREPASFLRSMHMELMRDNVETETDLAKAIAREESEGRGEVDRDSAIEPGLRYSVDYVEALRRYHAVFPPEQVLVLIYDDFRADNERIVRQVLRFLAVDDRGPIELLEAYPSVRVRSPRMEALVQSLSLGKGPAAHAVKTAIKTVTPERVRRHGLSVLRRRVLYGEPRAPDEDLMRELRHRFKGEVVALSECLGRDLVTLWGYDTID
jgi:hypothetical protein